MNIASMTMTMALCILALMGCASNEKSLPLEVTRSFEEAFASDDPNKTAELFTEDAQILVQERPLVQGIKEVRSYIAEQMSPIIMFNADTNQTLVRDDVAIETGSYTYRDVRRGSDIEFGKYMHVWKNVDGTWKIYRAMFNTDEPIEVDVSVTHATEDQKESGGQKKADGG
jgi:ketosteroid isomerase-like protein